MNSNIKLQGTAVVMINDELDNEDMPVGRDLGPTDDNTIAVGNISSPSSEERGGNAAGAP